MKLSKQGKLRIVTITALAVIFALIISVGGIISPKAKEASGTAVVYAGDMEYFKLKAGDKDIAIFESEAKAQEVISLVKSKYVDVRARNPVVTLTPELTVEKITVAKSAQQPEVNTNPQTVMREITAGDTIVKTYVVQAGDTLWGIADANKLSVEDIEKVNPDLDVDHIIEGEEIVISSESPQEGIIKVTVVYEESREIPVEYKTVYEEDSEMSEDDEGVVKTEGKEGKARIIEKVTAVNGVIDNRTEVSKTEILRPVNEVILRGTKPDSEEDETEEETEEESEEGSEESEESEEYEEETSEDCESEESKDSEDSEEYSDAAESYDEDSSEEYTEEYSKESSEETSEETSEEDSAGESDSWEDSSESTDESQDYEEDYGEESDEESSDEDGDYTEPEPTSSSDNQEETFRDPVDNEDMEMPEESYSDLGYSSSGGQAIVDYAMQFIGNPYVWGGTSLTNGCDCSGFIYSVFNDCGYGISRWPDDDYPHISASELQPGDICVYGHHYSIYIGNGMEISAINEAQGINTHPMYYSTSGFMYGLRIVQ